MQYDSMRGAVVRAARASLLVTAAALAACSEKSLVQPEPSVPGDGPNKPSAAINITPSGTLLPAKIAFATGSPLGEPARVQLYDASGKQLAAFYAFTGADDFTAGVDVAVGDVNGDSWPDIIAGEGPTPNTWRSPGSLISIWDGKTGSLLQTVGMFGTISTFYNGVRVAAGDLDSDGKAEILACTGAFDALPIGDVALAFKLGSTQPLGDWLKPMWNSQGRQSGCHVAAGDINGDGRKEMLAQFDGPDGRLYAKDVVSGTVMYVPNPLGSNYSGQAAVATADVNGDHVDDVILSFLQDSAVVRVFDGAQLKQGAPPVMLKSLKPLDSWQGTGVDIATHDVNGDGKLDLLYKATKATTGTPYSSVGAKAGPSLKRVLLWFTEPGLFKAGGPVG